MPQSPHPPRHSAALWLIVTACLSASAEAQAAGRNPRQASTLVDGVPVHMYQGRPASAGVREGRVPQAGHLSGGRPRAGVEMQLIHPDGRIEFVRGIRERIPRSVASEGAVKQRMVIRVMERDAAR